MVALGIMGIQPQPSRCCGTASGPSVYARCRLVSRWPPLWTRAVRCLLPDIPALLPGAGRLDLKPPFVAGETSTAYDRTRLAFKLADQPRSPDI